MDFFLLHLILILLGILEIRIHIYDTISLYVSAKLHFFTFLIDNEPKQ